MPYQPFHNLFPKIAERETRTVTVPKDSNIGLPPASYAFLEMFCNEPGCDCRRVFFYVVSSLRNDVEAVIAYGWESPAFYAKWLRHEDPRISAELQGPVLNFGSPQSHLATGILEMFSNVLLPDELYIERVKRHYWMFRNKIDGKPTPGATHAKKRSKKKRNN